MTLVDLVEARKDDPNWASVWFFKGCFNSPQFHLFPFSNFLFPPGHSRRFTSLLLYFTVLNSPSFFLVALLHSLSLVIPIPLSPIGCGELGSVALITRRLERVST